MPAAPVIHSTEKADRSDHRPSRRMIFTLAVVAALTAGRIHSASAQSPDANRNETAEQKPDSKSLEVDVLARGTSSASARRDALNRLPMNRLTREEAAQVRHVLENRSIFRRLPRISIEADPEVYSHFTHNPESAVGIWRALGISKFELQQTGPNVWYGDAGDGSTGTIHVLERTPRRQLLLCEGEYKSPLLAKPIKATAVMHLRTNFAQNQQQQPQIVHDLDLFVTFPSQAIDTVVKVIAPLSHLIADRNFRELSLFIRFMQVAMERQPGWVEQAVQRADGMSRQQRLDLLKVSAQAYVAARDRARAAESVQRANLEALISPYRIAPASGESSENRSSEKRQK